MKSILNNFHRHLSIFLVTLREREREQNKLSARMNIGTDRQRNKATDDDTEEDDNCFVCAAMNIQVNFELLMFKLFSFQRQRLIASHVPDSFNCT